MSNIILGGGTSGSGSVTLQAPNTNSNQTINIPDASGTAMVTGAMPAFGAYFNGSLTGITNNSFTKVIFDVEEFDTNNNFTSSKFTPTVAGYYQLNWCINLYTAGTGEVIHVLYKNGLQFKYGTDISATNTWNVGGSALVYANGTSDYFEIYCYQNTGSSKNLYPGQAGTWFNGFLARAA